ncbi:MAG TPA: DNA repair ATPase, partial [Streptomyces sp.]|nr:DNA repair ATPase [Streptomyces sp.]
MAASAADLAARAQALNARRVETFGGTGLELAGTGALRTEHPRVPCDIVQIGGLLLFGGNPPAGHGRPTAVGDVLTLYRPHHPAGGDGGAPSFEAAGPDAVPGLLDDPGFRRDFEELYRYYRQARLLRLRRTGTLLLAVFAIGERPTDIRVLRWRVAPDGSCAYLDAKGERDHTTPPAHDVAWTPAGREDHVPGRHPHVSVAGLLYVSTVGGFLTVKADDDTETAEGIHSEPVDDPLQSLADAEISHARVGPLVLLRVLPYNETAHRHLVFNTRTQEVVRLDGIGQGCRRLPDDQGVVFPGGYCLADAPAGSAARTFDTDTEGLEYENAVRSPNGEDVLHVFHAPARGRTLLLPYNLIRREVSAPIPALGHALFEDGTLVVLRGAAGDTADGGGTAGGEAVRTHPVQLWHTPYVSDAHAAAHPAGTGPLARIGNAELVRAVSDCLSAARMAEGAPPTVTALEAVTAACARITDQYPWLGAPGPAGDVAELEALGEPLRTLRETAEQTVEEYARVAELRDRAAAAVAEAAGRVTALVRRARGEAPDTATGWVGLLAELRRAQGAVESLRELRHADTGH